MSNAPDGEHDEEHRASERNDGHGEGMVRILRAVCLECGQEPPGIIGPNGEDLRFPAIVSAKWLHELGAQRPHSWSCDGQVQVETEPIQ